VIGKQFAKRSKEIVLRSVNHAYQAPHTPFRTTTRDGIPLAGVHLCRHTPIVVIYAHGFLTAVLLHAALFGGVHGVATIGAVGHLRYMRGSTASLGLRLLFGTRIGRLAAEVGRGTRIGPLRISRTQNIASVAPHRARHSDSDAANRRLFDKLDTSSHSTATQHHFNAKQTTNEYVKPNR